MGLGLADKEARVYLALLTMGKGTADQIAQETKLNRSTTYVQLKQLLELGLVSTFKEGKKTMFASETPNNLDRLLEKQILALESKKTQVANIIPELLNVFSTVGNRPVIRIFEGKEGLASMRSEVLRIRQREFCVITSVDEMAKNFSVKELQNFSNERARRGLKSYVLYNVTGDDIIPLAPQELRRLPREDFPFSADIYIYGNKVSFAMTKDHIVGVVIESASLAESMRSVFWLAWERAGATSREAN